MDRARLARLAAALAEDAAQARARALDGLDELEQGQFPGRLAEPVSPSPAESAPRRSRRRRLDEDARQEPLGDVRLRGDSAAAEGRSPAVARRRQARIA